MSKHVRSLTGISQVTLRLWYHYVLHFGTRVGMYGPGYTE